MRATSCGSGFPVAGLHLVDHVFQNVYAFIMTINIQKNILESAGAEDVPKPTYSCIFTLCHFCRSPPFPHPISRTRPAANLQLDSQCCSSPNDSRTIGYANREMRTALTQLLKHLSPIMGDRCRWAMLTSCLWRGSSIMLVDKGCKITGAFCEGAFDDVLWNL